MAAYSFLFCLADSSMYEKNMFGVNEIFLSPDVIAPDNIRTFRIPPGDVDIDELFRSNPAIPRKPSHTVIKTDALGRNFIRGLSKLECPSLVSVADTHHLHRPIERVSHYLKGEKFDVVSFENDRHHIKWFDRMGIRNLCWIPNLFLSTEKHCPVKENNKDDKVCFVGSLGKFHPYRQSLIGTLSHKIKNLDVRSATRRDSYLIYNKSFISLNVSLNGDLNWRFFEVLASGGFLLTDRLCKESGVSTLFQEGVHFEGYSGEEELLEKINFYRRNRSKAEDIALSGYSQYWDLFAPKLLRKEGLARLFRGRGSSLYDWIGDGFRSTEAGPLRAYQAFQEIHRRSLFVDVFCMRELCDDVLIRDIKDFQRLRIISGVVDGSEIEWKKNGEKHKHTEVLLIKNLLQLSMINKTGAVKPEFVILADSAYTGEYRLSDESSYKYHELFDCYIRDGFTLCSRIE